MQAEYAEFAENRVDLNIQGHLPDFSEHNCDVYLSRMSTLVYIFLVTGIFAVATKFLPIFAKD